MYAIIEKACAKINLTLSVLSKRADGYHEIDSLMHTVSLSDTVGFSPAAEISLAVSGAAPAGRENLMWRAAELFFRESGLPGGVAMSLEKQIPAEAGMGGGSADAAAVLRGLSRMTGAGYSLADLARMGAALGADVPFCVAGGAARCRGIGERLSPLPAWEGLPLLIVRPAAAVSTARAYGAIDRRKARSACTADLAAAALSARDPAALSRALSNDFEAALFPEEPVLSEAKAFLAGTGFPNLMTGSGAAFFVLAGGAAREQLQRDILAAHPDWFTAPAETTAGIL